MTYAFNKAEKSVPFTKTFDGTFAGAIGKGTPIEIKGNQYEVVSVRRVEFGNRLIKVIGKAKLIIE